MSAGVDFGGKVAEGGYPYRGRGTHDCGTLILESKIDCMYTPKVIWVMIEIPGYVMCMAGGPVECISNQPIVTVSLMEAEYVACFFAMQVVM